MRLKDGSLEGKNNGLLMKLQKASRQGRNHQLRIQVTIVKL
jgi:hypothetical protein